MGEWTICIISSVVRVVRVVSFVCVLCVVRVVRVCMCVYTCAPCVWYRDFFVAGGNGTMKVRVTGLPIT